MLIRNKWNISNIGLYGGFPQPLVLHKSRLHTSQWLLFVTSFGCVISSGIFIQKSGDSHPLTVVGYEFDVDMSVAKNIHDTKNWLRQCKSCVYSSLVHSVISRAPIRDTMLN